MEDRIIKRLEPILPFPNRDEITQEVYRAEELRRAQERRDRSDILHGCDEGNYF